MKDYRSVSKHGRTLITAVVLGIYILLAAASDPLSEAKCVISNRQGKADVQLRNGDLDAGFSVSFTVTNEGKAGVIKVAPWLTSSEGEWRREQNLTFAAGESRELKYFFHEPTINAENLQFGCKCSPD